MKKKPKFVIPTRRTSWLWAVLLTVVAIYGVPKLPVEYSRPEVLLAIVGGVWSWAFYRHKNHSDDARFFKELFTDFNARYDRINDRLASAMRNEKQFSAEEEQHFIDYFNLCGEEWLFYQAGYIYPAVWETWKKGMKQYGADARVAKLWQRERESESYYGFELPDAPAVGGRNPEEKQKGSL